MAGEPDAPKKEEVDKALKDLREKGKMRSPDEITHAVRVIKRSDIRAMIEDLLQRFGGMGQAELIEKIMHLERALAGEREKAERDFHDRIVQLEKQVAIERGRTGDLEAKLAAALAEVDRLAAELAALQKSTSQDSKSKAELEKRIAELEARIVEIEIGLDYFDLEEEPDPERVRGALEEASKRMEGRAPTGPAAAVRDRLAQLSDRAKTGQQTFDLLKEKMYDGKGTIGVVVDMVKALERGASVEQQARRVSESLDAGRA